VRLLVVEQQPDAPAGLLGEWARVRGAAVDVLRATKVVKWPDPTAANAVIALGSDRSVHASDDPWIAAELRFLRAAHDAGVPVLGICFGGQALAAALGGAVARGPELEIGWIDIDGADGYGGRWFAWHEDSFTAPPGAVELARSAAGPQAFRVGRSVGLQFHPEVTPAIVDDWIAGGRDAIADSGPMRDETHARASQARRRAFVLFDRIAAPWGA
jgi:GMP synthase-like glutamine amidotransferase